MAGPQFLYLWWAGGNLMAAGEGGRGRLRGLREAEGRKNLFKLSASNR